MDSRVVTCQTLGCHNFEMPLELPNDGTRVVCGGGCDNILEEQADWYTPPEPSSRAVEELLSVLESMTPEQKSALTKLLLDTEEEK